MKLLLTILGFVAVALGVIGIFLPIMPTTPFILLAAYLFSKSSETFYLRLISIPTFGKIIDDWNSYGIIPLNAKIFACCSITLVLIYFWFATYPIWIPLTVSGILLSTVSYILYQPSTRL